MRGLRHYRERAGLSLVKLSEASGVGVKTIFNAETGRTSPSVSTLERMVVPLGVSVVQVLAADELLSGQRDDEKAS